MSTSYRTVGWNPLKRHYDLLLVSGVAVYLTAFLAIQATLRPTLTIETLLIRALGSAAFLLLHVILCIGPLARLDRRVLPLLYNRRHMGVTMFTLALAHGLFAIVQFHSLGTRDPIASVLTLEGGASGVGALPFQAFGFVALLILFLMAATSHDFWLHNLTAPVWKALHMGVYVAYTLIVLHVMLGVLQGETHAALGWLLGAGAATVLGLHITAALRERRVDQPPAPDRLRDDGFVDVCHVDDIPEKRAVIRCLSGERVAIFRYDGKISALSNVCQHQNGPLGEGRIVNGCVVCPWHGYEYVPDTGASPPPFTEKVPTFVTRVVDGRVWVDPRPLPAGTRVEPATISAVAQPAASAPASAAQDEFFIGYAPPMPTGVARVVRVVTGGLLAAAVLGGLILAIGHLPIDGGTFAFGQPERVTGILQQAPYPAIRLDGTAAGAPRALLVAPGKFGAESLVDGLGARRVAFDGMRIARDGHEMFEIVPGTIEAGEAAGNGDGIVGADPDAEGDVTLEGEIVDSKCYLGVMVPGEGRTHRECAVLCLRGGIPPALRVRDREGRHALVLLVTPHGGSLAQEAAPHAFDPIRMSGRLSKEGGWWVLRTDPAGWTRVGD